MADIDVIPTGPRAVEHELRHVRALIQLEQREDQAQFKLRNASASIKERRRRGFTWYPITITKEDIGFGGKVVLEIERPSSRQELHLFRWVRMRLCLVMRLLTRHPSGLH